MKMKLLNQGVLMRPSHLLNIGYNGFITMSNDKMSKSQGNILKIKDFKTKMSGQVLRLALMNSHYKPSLDWTDSDKKLSKHFGQMVFNLFKGRNV